MSVTNPYVDQDARGLSLNILLGEFDPRQLTLLQSGRVKLPSLDVQAHIIGASDVIQVRLPEFQGILFSEVFACTQVRGVKHVLRCGSLEDVLGGEIRLRIRPKLHYSFDVQLLELSKNLSRVRQLENVAADYAAKPEHIGLVLAFPPNPDLPAHEPPKTIVAVSCEGGNHVRTQTVHMYDSFDQLVITESILKF